MGRTEDTAVTASPALHVSRAATILRRMRPAALIAMLAAILAPCLRAVPAPDSVAILYNAEVPESRQLATAYRQARGIPAENMIPLEMPATRDVSRADYEKLIAAPLREEFDRRRWWKRSKGRDGVTAPTLNRIKVLVIMRGVPLRISPTPRPAPPPPKPGGNPAPVNPMTGRDDASVDSELAMFGVEGVPADGPLDNKYHKADKPIADAGHPYLVLTARIDAASADTCRRMIADAVEAEKTGLFGMACVDIANKFPQGDQWLEAIIAENLKTGIPTITDRFNDTLPKHWPAPPLAIYHGWYDWNLSGPFLHPDFRFRKGAIATHIHSFSAEQLADPDKNWSAGLLEKGAAVTVGNVFEPYLHLTHDLSILHQRLLAGYSWVEACWMAMPATSWQGVTLGDPLYQPFGRSAGKPDAADADFCALREAIGRLGSAPDERLAKLAEAAERTRSGVYHEAAGLELRELKRDAEAVDSFRKAKALYQDDADKLRQDFHTISIDRAAGRKDLAIRGLRDAQVRYTTLPALDAVKGWLDILDPPPPPPADPE
jgi:uncharacterized protein (TIGR03790 family)